MLVDFTGSVLSVVNPRTGEIKEVPVFVAVLGASSYTYAEAVESQALQPWISAHMNAFEYFGGVPEIIVPDNLRAPVTKACRYEPDLNSTYREMDAHYGAAVIPRGLTSRGTRPRWNQRCSS